MEAVARYPEPVEGAQGVFYCGYNSEKSFGGSAWLIQRPEGNVMVDSPRFDPKLVKNVKVCSLSNYPTAQDCLLLQRVEPVYGHAHVACTAG